MSFRIFLFIFFCLQLTFSCKVKKKEVFTSNIAKIDDEQYFKKVQKMGDPCKDPLNYAPDPDFTDQYPYKTIKVNFHIIRNNEGKGNFSEESGKKYIATALRSANENLRKNQKMKLPVGNDTPALPINLKYELTPDPNIPDDDGIYFHNDDDHYFIINKGKNRNNYDRSVFEKYGVQKGEVLNVFLQDNHLDSLGSKTYKPNTNGIAFSTWIKGGLWYHAVSDTIIKNGKKVVPNKYTPPKQLNHEIGHVFSLRHSWRRDGCEDTPDHANCWSSKGVPPCVVASNNMMDYNPHRSALTPCQIGMWRMTATRNKTKRNLIKKTWCEFNDEKTITIKRSMEWNDCKELQGNIIIKPGAQLIIRCRVALAKGAEIIVAPGGKLLLDGAEIYNDCGDEWKGIRLLHDKKLSGKVQYARDSKLLNLANPANLVKPEEIRS